MISKNKKELLLVILSTLLFSASLFFISKTVGEDRSFGFIIGVLGLLLLSMISFGFASSLVRSKRPVIISGLVSAVLVLIFFQWHWLQFISALFIFLGMWLMDRYIKGAEKESLHFGFRRTVSRGLGYLLTAVVMLIAFNVFLLIFNKLQENPDNFYQSIAASVVRGAEPIFSRGVEGYDTEGTVNDFLDTSRYFEPENVPDIAPNSEIRQVQLQSLEEVLGIDLTGREKLDDVLKDVVYFRVKNTLRPVEKLLPLIYALLIFVSLRFLQPILVFLAGIIGGVLFKSAVRAGWIKMTSRTVEVETPELS